MRTTVKATPMGSYEALVADRERASSKASREHSNVLASRLKASAADRLSRSACLAARMEDWTETLIRRTVFADRMEGWSLSINEVATESATAMSARAMGMPCRRRRPSRRGDGVFGRDRRKVKTDVLGAARAGVKDRCRHAASGAPLLTGGASNPGGTSSSSESWYSHPSYDSAISSASALPM